MQKYLENQFFPLYGIALIAIVWVLSTIVSLVVPFFRREVATEGEARITPLDGLRGILCFGVMCHHSAMTFDYINGKPWGSVPSHFYELLGQSSVAMFFGITAFLFWGRVVAKDGSIDVLKFFRGRAYRLIPLYAFSCLFVIAVLFTKVRWLSFGGLHVLSRMAVLGIRPWGSLGGVDVGNVNAAVVWSLQYEWGFYLLLPALALIVKAKQPERLWLLFIAALALYGAGPLLFFFPGMLAVYVCRNADMVKWLKSAWASLAIIALAVALPIVTGHGYGWRAFAMSACIFVPIACGNSVFGLLTLRGLRLMGVISYSVYLLHAIVLYIARPKLIEAMQHGVNGVRDYWLEVFALAIATCVLSLLTYRFVEWPFIQYERNSRGAPKTDRLVKEQIAVVVMPVDDAVSRTLVAGG